MADWKKLNEGVWVDPAGVLHLSMPDLLEANGYEATPANIELLTNAAREMALDLGAELDESE
jgi:hypothetical protein